MTYAEDVKLRDALRKPFDPKQIGKLPRKTKTGSTIYLDYVGHAAVVDRLNTVAPDWTLTLDRIVEADGHVLAAIGTMTIGGKPMTEVGEPTGQNTYGQELQTALGNLIRRAAMRFGLGIDLWSKEELHGSEDSAAVATGEKSQGADRDAGRPAADEPGARVGLGEGTTVTPGSTIPESEVTDAAPAHTNAPPSDDRVPITEDECKQLVTAIGTKAKALIHARNILGRQPTELSQLTHDEFAWLLMEATG